MFPCISSSDELEPITFVQPYYQLPRVLARGQGEAKMAKKDEKKEKRLKGAHSLSEAFLSGSIPVCGL